MNIGEKNVGMIDRVVRIIIGAAFLACFVLDMVAAPLSFLVALIGIITLVTGAIGTCPAYSLMGKSTVEKRDNRRTPAGYPMCPLSLLFSPFGMS